MKTFSARASRLWAAFGLLAVFVALPGPQRSLFSGIPFSLKAHFLLAALLVVALAMTLFPPRQGARARWLLALALACGAKAVIAPAVRFEGWHGRYSTAQVTNVPIRRVGQLTPVRFFRGRVRNFRVDRLLAFDDRSFALFYVNDWSLLGKYDPNAAPRDLSQPLRVEWTGYMAVPAAATLSTTVTATGAASVTIDGATVFSAVDPSKAPIIRSLSAGEHQFQIVYEKPAGAKARFALAPLPFPVMPERGQNAEMRRARLAANAIAFLGVIALLLFAGALADAYGPIARFLLGDLWDAPDRILLTVFAAAALTAGVAGAVKTRGLTVPLGNGDDPFAYEAAARLILFNGPLMQLSAADTQPYYFYPLYSYVLAAAHAMLGEDYGTIRFLNWMCIAASGILWWVLLQRWLTRRSMAVLVVAFSVIAYAYLGLYANTAYTDNLYLPLCLAILLAGVTAFERHSWAWFLTTGFLTALGAATRPSLVLFPPVLIVTVFLLDQTSLLRRARETLAFVIGFAGGIAPFVARNWIVAHRLVLTASMYVMLPLFLFAPEDAKPSSRWTVDHAHTASQAIDTSYGIVAAAPWHFAGVALRKALFTLGLTRFGNPASEYPYAFVIIPLLFGVAAWARRIPRPVMITVTAFAVSHLIAMVVANPWSYGYKNIIPFHLALLAGSAFLLPRRGDVVDREAAIPRTFSAIPRSVSVVLPTYNEKESLRKVIVEFLATGLVDEVIVVNNNAVAGTSEEVIGTGAREVLEPRQGYGAATRRGLNEATGDYIVICEPDGTFLARDIVKLLAYADDFDIVYGSRTSQPLVWRGANMGFFLRFGNWAVAKYMQLIFNTPTLSDVGCTMRLIKRSVAAELANEFSVDGSEFGVEMMVLSARHRYRIAQIPVNYAERVGASSVTGDPAKAFRLGLQMIWLITKHRLRETVISREERSGIVNIEPAPPVSARPEGVSNVILH
jgi:hypothetical protein